MDESSQLYYRPTGKEQLMMIIVGWMYGTGGGVELTRSYRMRCQPRLLIQMEREGGGGPETRRCYQYALRVYRINFLVPVSDSLITHQLETCTKYVLHWKLKVFRRWANPTATTLGGNWMKCSMAGGREAAALKRG
jgi:hypothetical protein